MTRFVRQKTFDKDLKKLKIKSIEEDLLVFQKAFTVSKTNLKGCVQCSGFEKQHIHIPIFKQREFRCRSIPKGSQSGVRIIFTYLEEQDIALYVEAYHKNKKDNYDLERIKTMFKHKTKEEIIHEWT